jgi:hypothetical protein
MSTILTIDRSLTLEQVYTNDKLYSGLGAATIIELDERSLAITEIDVSKIELVVMGCNVEYGKIRWDRHKRLKQMGYICLDIWILYSLLSAPHLIPTKWKKKNKTDSELKVYFEGTIYDREGTLMVSCLRTARSNLSARWSPDRWPPWTSSLNFLMDQQATVFPSAVIKA